MILRQFILQEYCLRCNVCCRFPDHPSAWAPHFTRREVMNAVHNNIIPPELFSQPSSTSKEQNAVYAINLVQYEQGFRCPCFSLSDNKCLIYPQRPFECQLYPFVLLARNGQFFLAQDRHCPYLKGGDTNAINAQKKYLQEEFKKKESISFLNHHRDLFGNYDSYELDIVFPICLDTSTAPQRRPSARRQRRRSVSTLSMPKVSGRGGRRVD